MPVSAATSRETIDGHTYLGEQNLKMYPDFSTQKSQMTVTTSNPNWQLANNTSGLPQPTLSLPMDISPDFPGFEDGGIIYYVPMGEANYQTNIIVTYPAAVGTYKGKEVSAKLTFSNFAGVNRQHHLLNAANRNINIGTSMLRYVVSGVESWDTTFEFYYVDSGEKVNITAEDAVYIGVAELDYDNGGYEGASSAAAEKLFLSSGTTLNFGNLTSNTTGNVYNSAAWNQTSVVTSGRGNPDFAVFFKFTSNDLTMKTIDTVGHIVMNFSTSTIGWFEPEMPAKYIMDKNGDENQTATYNTGDQFDFEITQKVHALGVDASSRYSTFKIVDSLPKEVDYVSAKLYDQNEQEITDGTIAYDQNTHTVTWTASQNFLNTVPLNGETYTLKITVKANDQLTQGVVNSAKTIINDQEFASNQVTVTPTPAPEVPTPPATGLAALTASVTPINITAVIVIIAVTIRALVRRHSYSR